MDIFEDGRLYISRHFEIVDIQLLVERVVEVSSHLISDVLIEGLRVLDQMQRIAEDSRANRKLLASVYEASLKSSAVFLEGV